MYSCHHSKSSHSLSLSISLPLPPPLSLSLSISLPPPHPPTPSPPPLSLSFCLFRSYPGLINMLLKYSSSLLFWCPYLSLFIQFHCLLPYGCACVLYVIMDCLKVVSPLTCLLCFQCCAAVVVFWLLLYNLLLFICALFVHTHTKLFLLCVCVWKYCSLFKYMYIYIYIYIYMHLIEMLHKDLQEGHPDLKC